MSSLNRISENFRVRPRSEHTKCTGLTACHTSTGSSLSFLLKVTLSPEVKPRFFQLAQSVEVSAEKVDGTAVPPVAT